MDRGTVHLTAMQFWNGPISTAWKDLLFPLRILWKHIKWVHPW